MNLLNLYIAGADFNEFAEPEVVFEATSVNQTICRNVIVVDDEISENTEYFLIEMSTSNHQVLLENYEQVSIIDNDGE